MIGWAESEAEIGVIGGSGLYDLASLRDVRETRVSTPFGDPSDNLVIGMLRGRRVAFLPRHGRAHRINPSEIPAQANIYALKSLGVREIISVSAVGSLREDLAPGDLVVPDQIVDRTHGNRPSTFFGTGLVVHVPFADPYCERLRPTLVSATRRATPATVHDGGTYCCMEGPQFSTRAESNLYRSWGMDLIGMTALPEARLAREAEICYVALALVTDYDCWRGDDYESVSADGVADVMADNGAAAQAAIVELVDSLDAEPVCPCQDALANSMITKPDGVPFAVRDQLRLLLEKYFPPAVHAVTDTRSV